MISSRLLPYENVLGTDNFDTVSWFVVKLYYWGVVLRFLQQVVNPFSGRPKTGLQPVVKIEVPPAVHALKKNCVVVGECRMPCLTWAWIINIGNNTVILSPIGLYTM